VYNEDILRLEAWQTGISYQDLKKRRCHLGGLNENIKYTAEGDQTPQTKRQERVLRNHELLYSLRVFASFKGPFDMDWRTAQRLTVRDDPRYPLQGFLQATDPDSWDRHRRVAENLKRMGGPPPPKGSVSEPSSSSKPAQPVPPMANPPPRQRSRSPRRAWATATTSKACPRLRPESVAPSRKRDRPTSSSSSSAPGRPSSGESSKRRKKVFAPRVVHPEPAWHARRQDPSPTP